MTQETFKLKGGLRTITGKKVSQLRKQKLIPAVLYGKGFKNKNLVLDLAEFEKIQKSAGSSSLVDLKIDDDKALKILIGDLQKDPVNDKIVHADLIKVNMKEKIRTNIPLEIIGESAAVVDLEGNLITNKDEIEVECLPDALVSSIQVDISVLKTFDDNIKISDLNIPEGIEVLDDQEETLFMVTPPRSEEELEEDLTETKEAEAEAVAELESQATGEVADESGAEAKENKSQE